MYRKLRLTSPGLLKNLIKLNCGIYIALYHKAQRALQHFVGDLARLLILGANCSRAVHNFIRKE